MDVRPIGVCDSGMGGLTAVRALRALLPGEDIVFLGDTARMPYGGRTPAELMDIARSDVDFLLRMDVKAIQIACGTMDSNAMPTLGPEIPVPTVGVIAPAAEAAAAATKNGRIGVLSTVAAHKSGAYLRALELLAPDAGAVSVGCPLLASMAEAGRLSPGDGGLREELKTVLAPILELGADTLLLGCTHYPLLRDAIEAEAGPGLRLIDSGAEGAKRLAAMLGEAGLLSGRTSGGVTVCVTTGDPGSFRSRAELFLGGGETCGVFRTVL